VTQKQKDQALQMQTLTKEQSNNDASSGWLPAFGWTARQFVSSFSPTAWRNLRAHDVATHFRWMGPGSLPLVTFSAIFVALALTTQVTLELDKYQAQDMAGPMIAIGLLRELGPLTISMAWSAQVAVCLCGQAAEVYQGGGENDFGTTFILPRYLAALAAGLGLSAFGLVIGFSAAAVYAPLVGVSSSADFLETARLSIKDKDVCVYFVKLVLINPTLAFLVGCSCGRSIAALTPLSLAKTVAALFIVGAIVNYFITALTYLF
jgi:phospholipid/cholesterol/gamma-HCH transport system permease protein